MNIYYYANQVYQFANILPVFKQIGGQFYVKKRKKVIQFKYYYRHRNFTRKASIKIQDIKNLPELNGVIISSSNTRIKPKLPNLKTIFIGHGTGDKKYGGNPDILSSYDFIFVAGEKHVEKMKDVALEIPEEKLIKIGNCRFDEYINREIDRDHVMKKMRIKDTVRKNILYAPTWRFGNGTLKKYVRNFCTEITKKYNLIIRPHYHERRYIKPLKLWVKFNGINHVYFSNPAEVFKQDTMTDFAISDLMISDTSSILYEYLITGNPIIIANTDYDNLHKMPDKYNVQKISGHYDESKNILDLIDNSFEEHNRVKYENLLQECFYFNDGKSTQRAIDFINKITA